MVAATHLLFCFNLPPPEQNGRHIANDMVWYIFIIEKFFYVLIKVSLKFVPKGSIDKKKEKKTERKKLA